MKHREYFLLMSLLLVAVTGCQQNNKSSGPIIVEDDYVPVYVLAGQSNMEGSTYFDNGQDWLRKAMNAMDLDPEPCFDGIPNVMTSHYGFYPYDDGGRNWETKTPYASNKTDPMAGEFLPTKVGMGADNKSMGPELGLAYTLQEYAEEDRPFFIIKCAFSGSGFNNNPSWRTASNQLYARLVQFTTNNLHLIEDMGYEPRIEAFVWHQGESDSNSSTYVADLEDLVGSFREDFQDYAEDGDGNEIAFIDALIYDGPNFSYNGVDNLNAQKIQFSEQSPNNFYVDSSFKTPNGLKLDIPGNRSGGNMDGGYGIYHYTTKDCYRLGQAYANIIIDNDLI